MGGTSGISIIAGHAAAAYGCGHVHVYHQRRAIVLGLVFLGRAVIGATLYSSVALSFYVWVL
jgi:hypothetical protein